MEPLITLVTVTAVLLLLGACGVSRLRRIPVSLRGGLSAMFLLTGISHFIGMREDMIAMIPDLVPAPELVVTTTGVAELAGAVGLLIPRIALLAASALTILLIGVFPANVTLALSGESLPWYDQLLWRTLAQIVYLAAAVGVVLFEARSRRNAGPGEHTPRAFRSLIRRR